MQTGYFNVTDAGESTTDELDLDYYAYGGTCIGAACHQALSHSTTTWMLLCRAMNMRSSHPLPKLSDIMVLNSSFSHGATIYVVPKTVVDTVLPLVLVLCLMCSSSCWCYF